VRGARVARQLFHEPALARVLSAYGLFCICENAVWIAVIVYAYGRGGPTAAGVVAAAQLAPAAVCAPMFAVAVDRHSPGRMLVVGYLAQAAGCLVMTVTAAAHGPALLVYAGAVLASTFVAVIRPAQTAALIVLYTAFRIPFTTFLIRAYMVDLSPEVDEAAKIDGASPTQTFWKIILPMCRPILVSAALLQALFAWNEFVFALVFISSGQNKTLPVGLMDMQSRLLTDWPVQFAGLTMAALPMIVLFLIGQRQFLRGLTDGIGK